MSAIEEALLALMAMRDDYKEAAAQHGDEVAMGNYCRGKRDAYSRAVACLVKARREETRWQRIKAVFR